MTPDAILALYEWGDGACFRCSEVDLFVTHVGDVTTPRGETYRLDACGACILIMETQRQRYATRKGVEYQPGTLGS